MKYTHLVSAISILTVSLLAVPSIHDATAQSVAPPADEAEQSSEGKTPSLCEPKDLGRPYPHFGPQFGFGAHLPAPPHLAAHLAEVETEIGIRSDQLDYWRDFTDALIAVAEPPLPPVGDENKKTEAFAFAMRMADAAVERGQKAEVLKKVIAVLRGKLSPEQLKKASSIEERLPPPHLPPPCLAGFGAAPPYFQPSLGP